METIFLPAILLAIPLGALALILHQRYRRPDPLPSGDPIRLVGRIVGPGNLGDRACGLGDEQASRFTLRTRDERYAIFSQGAVLRPGILRRQPELRVGDLVTLDATPTTRERQRGAYREPAREQILDAVRIVRGSWARARWAALPLSLAIAAALVGAYDLIGPWSATSRAATSLKCPNRTEVMIAPATTTESAMWCQTSDGKRHGPWVLSFSTGKPRVSGQYKEGKVTGIWTEYYPNGMPKAQGTLEDPWWQGQDARFFWQALKIDRWTYFYPDGREWVTGKYWEGKRHDQWIEYDMQNIIRWTGLYSRKGKLLKASRDDVFPGGEVPPERLGMYAPLPGLGKMTAPGGTATGAPSLMWGAPCLEPDEMLACSLRVLR